MRPDFRTVDRRTALRGFGATLAGSVFLGGVATARPAAPVTAGTPTTIVGEGIDLVGGGHEDVWTSVTVNRAKKPIRLSIWLTGDGFDHLTNLSDDAYFHLDFPGVDGSNYTFAGINWNTHGHPPTGVWTVPHFDFHYYFVDEADVEAITSPGPLPFLGVATYDIPEEQFPRHYAYETPRFIVKNMGEHLFDETSPEHRPNGEFTHTYIYGAYDPSIDLANPDGSVTLPIGPGGSSVELPTYDGDGTGRLTFTEPMITESFLRSDAFRKRDEVSVRVPTPDVFPEAGYYPTRYVMRYLAREDLYEIALEGMEWFPAAV